MIMVNITELFKNYLLIKETDTEDADITLYMVEDEKYYFAFNLGAYTLRHIFNGFICDENLILNEKKQKVFYCAIPKYDISTITYKITLHKYRAVIITPL